MVVMHVTQENCMLRCADGCFAGRIQCYGDRIECYHPEKHVTETKLLVTDRKYMLQSGNRLLPNRN